MENLFKYIKESLFDVDDNMSGMDEDVIKSVVINPESSFRQEYDVPEKRLYWGNSSEDNLNDSTFQNGVLNICSTFMRKEGKSHSVEHYLPGVQELVVKNTFVDRTRDDISPKNFIKKLTCGGYSVKSSKRISDIEVNIVSNKQSYPLNVWAAVNIDGLYRPTLENVKFNIIANSYAHAKSEIRFHNWPTLKNVSSNVSQVEVYSPSFFDEDDLDKLLPVFEWPLSVRYYDTSKKKEVEILVKGLKKAKAIANNPKRYQLKSPLFKLKENTRITDILDFSKFENLEKFWCSDNNISLNFHKGLHGANVRICEPKAFDINTYQKTKDGYYVYLKSEK